MHRLSWTSTISITRSGLFGMQILCHVQEIQTLTKEVQKPVYDTTVRDMEVHHDVFHEHLVPARELALI